jgi:anaerobic selenocysteine-containing dehydrogenase
MSETIHHRICPLCEACCGLELKVSEGKVISIRGHEADVFSAGYICPKGVALKDLHEDPDRLRTPLIKRDGAFVEASWDEAFAEIERRLPAVISEHGRDSVALSLGNPTAHKIGPWPVTVISSVALNGRLAGAASAKLAYVNNNTMSHARYGVAGLKSLIGNPQICARRH